MMYHSMQFGHENPGDYQVCDYMLNHDYLKRVKSIILLSGLLGGYRDVVLDGANIVHGGSNGSGMDGRRLISAMIYYENKGYSVHTVLKAETYHYMKKNKIPGLKKISELIGNDKILLFRKNDDHLAIVLALKYHAWLITHDTFKTHNETKPKERDTHPEWFEGGILDAYTRGTMVQDDGWVSYGFDWRIEKNEFLDPEIADINFLSSWYNSDNGLVIKNANTIRNDIIKLESTIREIDSISNKQNDLISECRNNIENFIQSYNRTSESPNIKSIINDLSIFDLKLICHNRSIESSWPLEKILDWEQNWELKCSENPGGYLAKIKDTKSHLKKKEVEFWLNHYSIPYKKSEGKQYLSRLYCMHEGDREILEGLIINDISKRGLFLVRKKNEKIFWLESYYNYSPSALNMRIWDQMYSKLNI